MSAGTADPDPAGIMQGRDDGPGGGGRRGGKRHIFQRLQNEKIIVIKIKNNKKCIFIKINMVGW
jgi:hypothetical protein